MIVRNDLELPLNDAHVYQQRGTAIAYRDQQPLHFTVLRCNHGSETSSFFGLARADHLEDFESIIDYGGKFEAVIDWFNSMESTK